MDPSSYTSDLSPFEYQAAGHDAKSISENIGILKHRDGGFILKPINKSPQGEIEIGFYDRLKDDQELMPVKKFIPEYFGFLYLRFNGTDVRFLKLKDVTHGFFKPCVMDVKIGKRTWDPTASLQKRTVEDAKYAVSRKEFGFCIPGYVVYNLHSQQIDRFGKEQGKKLDKTSTIDAFNHFFNLPSDHSYIIICHMLQKLTELLDWWNSQRIIHIFSSSVLLTYDAEKLKKLTEGKKPAELGEVYDWVKVFMIDFAHVFPANGTKDSNYISGLSKMIEVLKRLL